MSIILILKVVLEELGFQYIINNTVYFLRMSINGMLKTNLIKHFYSLL